MAIDINQETLLTLADAAKELPRRGGRKIHMSTVWRWANRGLKGIKLESIQLGGSTWTSREALQRYADRLSGNTEPTTDSNTLSTNKQHKAATQRLVKAGILSSGG